MHNDVNKQSVMPAPVKTGGKKMIASAPTSHKGDAGA
jgi:hypothetical protein